MRNKLSVKTIIFLVLAVQRDPLAVQVNLPVFIVVELERGQSEIDPVRPDTNSA